MIDAKPTPDFIVVEDDPLVLMDIRDMLMREFGALPLTLDAVTELGELMSVVSGPAVIIASCEINDLLESVRDWVTDALRFSAVLLTDPPKEAFDLPINVAFVPSPFSSELLLSSVTSACGHLLSRP